MDLDPAMPSVELKRNPNYKECRTETAVYFLGGPFSQWSRHGFTAELGGQLRKFNCAEQFMMAAKADLFGDKESLEKIMLTGDPGQIKALGRGVRGFDKAKWDAANEEIVFRGSLAKFTQNPKLKEYILATNDMLLVEGAHYDPVWGVALAFDDPAITDQRNWKGQNRLGKALMRARTEIRAAG